MDVARKAASQLNNNLPVTIRKMRIAPNQMLTHTAPRARLPALGLQNKIIGAFADILQRALRLRCFLSQHVFGLLRAAWRRVKLLQ